MKHVYEGKLTSHIGENGQFAATIHDENATHSVKGHLKKGEYSTLESDTLDTSNGFLVSIDGERVTIELFAPLRPLSLSNN